MSERTGNDDLPDPVDLGVRLASHANRLKLYLAHLSGVAVRRRVELDDLVQEVFVRVVVSARIGSPAPESEPELWARMAHVARHVVIDVARAARAAKRAGRAADLPLTRAGDSSSDGLRASHLVLAATGPATAVLRRETSRDLHAAFERLSPEHRRVLGLRQFQGLSAADCARRMGRTEVAVHSLYRRALAAWAEELGEDPSV